MLPSEYLRQPYARIVIPTGDGGYHAEILEFPGCFAQGETPGEAYRNLESAAIGWVEACLSQGQEVPSPSSNLGFSGKIALRLPRSIHRQAARMAERDGTSLNQFLLSAIACRVGAEDFYTVLVNRLESGTSKFAFDLLQRAVSAANQSIHISAPAPKIVSGTSAEFTHWAVQKTS